MNRYSQKEVASETYPLSVTICPHCQLVQLSEAPPIAAIVPRVEWISYREPSDHLRTVAQLVYDIRSDSNTMVRSLSPFDAPLLEIFRERYNDVAHVDLLSGATSATERFPYLETLQELALSSPMNDNLTLCDILTFRYLLEHSRMPVDTLKKFASLLAPSGMLIIEVPDSNKFLARQDYSFLWEEHTCYFTEATLRYAFAQAGLLVTAIHRYERKLEDSLVVFAQAGFATQTLPPAPTQLFAQFRSAYVQKRASYEDLVTSVCSTGQKIALIGMGHQALMFIHAFRIHDNITHFVDDDPCKIGTFAPGTHNSIIPFDALQKRDEIGLYFLAVGPAHEQRIVNQLAGAIARGAQIYSIFENSSIPTAIGVRA